MSKFILRKRAQIKMGENVGIMIIFAIIVVLGVVFYFFIFNNSITLQELNQARINSIEITQRASTLPELVCSLKGDVEADCFDKYKVMAMRDLRNNYQLEYFDLFGYSKIEIDTLFPVEEHYLIYDVKPADFKEQIVIYTPIVLYDPTTRAVGTYTFGMLNVVSYRK